MNSQVEKIQKAHALAVEDVLSALRAQESGLNHVEVEERKKIFGSNILPQAEGESPLKIFLRQLHNPLIYILMVSAVLAFLLGKPTDGAVVLSVVVINALIGFFQEYKAGKAIEALSSMVPNKVLVTRQNQKQEIDSLDLVPGDIVHLASGDKVAADLRLLKAKSLRIEEAALTGESVPVEKSLSIVQENAPLGDRVNLAFSGTMVSFGQGLGVVTAIGEDTELGRIAKMLKGANELETPLAQTLRKIGKVITLSVVSIALVLFAIAMFRGMSLVDSLLAAISLSVAAIPEGLPAIITIALAIGVRRMADRNAVIRKLPAVETLGSTNVICTDKTGTLTKNEMTVQGLWTPKGHYRVTGAGYDKQGEILRDGVVLNESQKDIELLLKAGVLCNDSDVVVEGSRRHVQGDPTEGALIVAFEKAGGVPEAFKKDHPRLDSIPFESERQYMASLHQDGEEKVIYMKGAPEVVMKAIAESQLEPQKVREQITQFAAEGMRVLAFARKLHSQAQLQEEDTRTGFEFLGLQAMIDPPREEVKRAIEDCHQAGIVVKMITGDHQETAQAIARELKIASDRPALVGFEIEHMSDADLEKAVGEVNVFARVAPEHKLRLVKALQKTGNVTAMTGDGVNDAPALKQSDIGVAMGITGTSVSKEAADLVLVDDNFATIKAAVEEGRRIYDNLIKSLAFVLPTNLGQALIILFAILFFPIEEGRALMPILPVQILWINLVASVTLALPLAFEAKEPDMMTRPPRNANEPILGRFVIWRTVIVALLMAGGATGLFLFELQQAREAGLNPDIVTREAQTMAVTTLVFFQAFYLLNCRSLRGSLFRIGLFSNPTVYLGFFVLFFFQYLYAHSELMNRLFHSAPLSWQAWLQSAAVAFLVMPMIAIEKLIRQKSSERESKKTRPRGIEALGMKYQN